MSEIIDQRHALSAVIVPSDGSPIAHPFIPNSAAATRSEMLDALGIESVEELYREIPQRLRFHRSLNLPEPLTGEYELKRHVEGLLGKNSSCTEYLNFLGAGCEQHHVPAVVDAIISRGEFLTAYTGNAYTDNGRLQAMFEYQSMMCSLLAMDVAGYPTTCGLQAASTAMRMAARITGRHAILIPSTINPRRRTHLHTYCHHTEVTSINEIIYEDGTGLMNLEDLRRQLNSRVAAVLVETPTFLGVIESQIEEIADLVHRAGALLVAVVNPISLGILSAPGDYGADIACGDAQPLGVHMNFGGGATGFIATRDISEHYRELPNLIVNIAPTKDGSAFGFTKYAYPDRLHYMVRERGREYTGTNTGLFAIANAVYLALMGPQGMRDLGETIVKNSHYARNLIGNIPGVQLPHSAPHFNEFVVNFDRTGRSVRAVNDSLLERGIFGGFDLSHDFPRLGQSALYCVSEIHGPEEIERLALALTEVVR
jgi:glycine dehydrogenase subunit 1